MEQTINKPPFTPLSPSKKTAIRRDFEAGASKSALVRKYGVSKGSVHRIVGKEKPPRVKIFKDSPNEEWRIMPDGVHEASNLGRIRNAETKRGLQTRQNHSGQLWIQLYSRERHRMRSTRIAPIIARLFLGEPKPGQKICFLDRNPLNVQVSNMVYKTQSEILKADYAAGVRKRKTGPRLSEQTRELIRQLWTGGQRNKSLIARTVGASLPAVCRTIHRRKPQSRMP